MPFAKLTHATSPFSFNLSLNLTFWHCSTKTLNSEKRNFSRENYIFMSFFPLQCADGPAVSRRETCPLINYTQPLCIQMRTLVCLCFSDCVHAYERSRLRHGLPAEVAVVQQLGDEGRHKWVVAARLKLQDAADWQCKYYLRKDSKEKGKVPVMSRR